MSQRWQAVLDAITALMRDKPRHAWTVAELHWRIGGDERVIREALRLGVFRQALAKRRMGMVDTWMLAEAPPPPAPRRSSAGVMLGSND
jgi:hypothetical protein